MAEIAEIIAKAFSFKGDILFQTAMPSGQKKRSLSGDKLNSLKTFDFTPIEEGINLTVEWFVKNYSVARK